MNDAPAIIVLGPTATGKSALALDLASRLGGEIISLDSMQVYQGMDIGTAKPSAADRSRVPHHLVDCQAVTEPSDAAQVCSRAHDAEQAVRSRGSLPIFAGGTALYIKLFVDGLFAGPAADQAVRAELAALAAAHGSAWLHQHLLAPVDPASAARLHPNDLRRIVRALEVYRATGVPISARQTQWGASDTACPYRLIGLIVPRDELYRRIEARVDAMLAAGLVAEVKRLRDAGIERNAVAAQAIGYKELLAHLAGRVSLDEAVRLIKRNTRRFAKHQLTWFRRDQRIHWFDVTAHGPAEDLAKAVLAWISS